MKNRNNPKYNKKDIVVIAVWSLGGALKLMHLEDVAIKSGELSPRSFSWTKYPEQINLELVRLALKNENASELSRIYGSMKDGWMVTPSGVLWCQEEIDIKYGNKSQELLQKELMRIQHIPAYSKFLLKELSDFDIPTIRAITRLDEYSPQRIISERTIALLNVAAIDKEFDRLIQYLIKQGLINPEVK